MAARLPHDVFATDGGVQGAILVRASLWTMIRSQMAVEL